jgi:hypothetical protein
MMYGLEPWQEQLIAGLLDARRPIRLRVGRVWSTRQGLTIEAFTEEYSPPSDNASRVAQLARRARERAEQEPADYNAMAEAACFRSKATRQAQDERIVYARMHQHGGISWAAMQDKIESQRG